jgi:predicted fused transcriptional regulator/phosphomethylpyrimidine kinase/predicted transcriptional regulator
MHPPDEMMVNSFLPSMRVLVSKKLHMDGMPQSKISKLLGVTQASVSHYVRGDPASAYASLSRLSIHKEDADRYSSLLAEDSKRNPVYATATLASIWNNLLGRGLLCAAHRDLYPSLAGCEVCIKTFETEPDERTKQLDLVMRAVSIIQDSPSFVKIMPEVSVNLAYAPGQGRTIGDVIGIPGRIVRVRNSARAMFNPEFGGSNHLARMVLLVKSLNSGLSVAINLRYDSKMRAIARKMGISIVEFGETYPKDLVDPIVEALRLRLRARHSSFDAAADVGGRGLEPNLYLFGKDPVEVARVAVTISRQYQAG